MCTGAASASNRFSTWYNRCRTQPRCVSFPWSARTRIRSRSSSCACQTRCSPMRWAGNRCRAHTALAWLAALALVLLAGDRRRLLATAREIDTFDADDRAWLRGRRTPQGRLNAGQKLNVIVTAALAVLFAVTGFFLWYGERNHAFRLQNALIVHDWLMYISFFLLLGHLYLSLIHPSTRHSLSAITRGWVRQDWALRHHPKWVEQMRQGER